MKHPLGVTLVRRGDQGATGVYQSPDGVEAFVTDEPYTLTDGRSLSPPLNVFMVDGPVFADDMGNAQTALAVNMGDTPVVPDGAVVHNGIFVTHNGVQVVHTG